MFIKDQIEFKKLVSTLRRELKAAGVIAPSHTVTLEIVAKALGATGYSELEAKLPKSTVPSVPVVAKYPLSNLKGRFDLVKLGEEGIPVEGRNFEELEGKRATILSCVEAISEVTRERDGSLDARGCETDVDWDSQTDVLCNDGFQVWRTTADTNISALQILVVPEDFDPEETGYRVRKALVAAYLDYAKEEGLASALAEEDLDGGTMRLIADTVGFALHADEHAELLKQLGA